MFVLKGETLNLQIFKGSLECNYTEDEKGSHTNTETAGLKFTCWINITVHVISRNSILNSSCAKTTIKTKQLNNNFFPHEFQSD